MGLRTFPQTYCIIDTETTGMRPPYSRVIDIGIIRIENGREVERFETLINPGVSIPPFIADMTGISESALVDAPPFGDMALDVERLLKDAVFVAHNVSFDYSFLQSEFKRLGMSFEAQTLCSASLSRTLYPKHRKHNLDAIMERHNLSCTARHRALPDADVVWQFFNALADEIPEETLRKAIEYRLGRNELEKTALQELPSEPGVYFFYGPDRELLYVGKSRNVRARVRSHFQDYESTKSAKMREEVRVVESIKTSGDLSAQLLEASLIKKESPLMNRALRKTRRLIIARRAFDDKGYTVLKLQPQETFEADLSVYALFRTMSSAKATMRDIAKEHRLCQKFLGLEQGAGPCFAQQLGLCDGACLGTLSPEAHNARIDIAFKNRRLKVWPYAGGIVINEKSADDTGTVFFVDNWVVQASFKYESGEYQPFMPHLGVFDFDSYKILARYIRNGKNRRTIRALSKHEFERAIAECRGDSEVVVS